MFLLTEEQMSDSLYALPEYPVQNPFKDASLPTNASPSLQDWKTRNDDYIQTPQSIMSDTIKVYALDCEMVTTEDGSTLARISVVNKAGEVIYDTIVMPDKPILDYLTQYALFN